jgi:hypothetical protein
MIQQTAYCISPMRRVIADLGLAVAQQLVSKGSVTTGVNQHSICLAVKHTIEIDASYYNVNSYT